MRFSVSPGIANLLLIGMLLAQGPARSSELASSSSSSPEDARETWAKRGFANAEISSLGSGELTPSQKHARLTHQFRITVVVLRNTGWGLDEVAERIKKTAGIYAQCGVSLSAATLVLADGPRGWVDIDGRDGGPMETKSRSPKCSPPRIALCFSMCAQAVMVRRACLTPNTTARNPRRSSTPLGSRTTSCRRDIGRRANPSYLPDAHELAHLLTDGGHIDDYSHNILSAYLDSANDQFTAEQCDRIKFSPMVSPI